MPNYRKPTDKETEKLNKARKMMAEGIEGEKDIFSRTMPTMAKAARDEMRAAKALRETVPASAREGEAYQDAGYKKGGKVKKMRKFADGGDTTGAEEPQSGLERLREMAKKYAKSEAIFRLRSDLKSTGRSAMSAGKTAVESMPVVRGAKELASRVKVPTSYDQEMGMKKGGKVSSASKRADGIAIRGKTRA